MSKEPKRNVYVGHRYVPKIMGEWDKNIQYEGLSIVTYQGTSYTSKKYVPVGIDISNEEFWVVTGNYNAQVETYRRDVNKYKQETDQKVDNYKQETDQKVDNYKQETDQKIDNYKQETTEQFEGVNENLTEQMTQIAINTKKTSNVISISDYDVDSTGANDSSNGFIQALNDLKSNETLLLEPNGTYKITKPVTVEKSGNLRIDGNGSKIHSYIDKNESSGIALGFEGVFKNTVTMTTPYIKRSPTLKVNTTSGIKKGDLIHIKSPEQFCSTRFYYKKGGTFTVLEVVDSTTIQISGGLPYNFEQANIDVYDPISVQIKDLELENMLPLPAGDQGIRIKFSTYTLLEDMFVDNFDECYHLANHYMTTVNRIESGRAYYTGSQMSYGLNSYTSNHFLIYNSTFNSGRRGVDINGFENSFKTLIVNSMVSSELPSEHNGFSSHQASYDLVAINCTFYGIGLSNNASLYNCYIYGTTGCHINTSENFIDSNIYFKSCKFEPTTIIIREDAQIDNNTARKVGKILVEDCITEHLIFNVGRGGITINEFIVRGGKNIVFNGLKTDTTINKMVYEDFNFDRDGRFIDQTDGHIKELIINDSKILKRYQVFYVTSFDKMILNNMVLTDNEDEVTKLRVESVGNDNSEVILVNTFLNNVEWETLHIESLTLVNSSINNIVQVSNIYNKTRTVMESF